MKETRNYTMTDPADPVEQPALCYRRCYDPDDGELLHCQLKKGHKGDHNPFPQPCPDCGWYPGERLIELDEGSNKSDVE